jgi:hypothetical protein
MCSMREKNFHGKIIKSAFAICSSSCRHAAVLCVNCRSACNENVPHATTTTLQYTVPLLYYCNNKNQSRTLPCSSVTTLEMLAPYAAHFQKLLHYLYIIHSSLDCTHYIVLPPRCHLVTKEDSYYTPCFMSNHPNYVGHILQTY